MDNDIKIENKVYSCDECKRDTYFIKKKDDIQYCDGCFHAMLIEFINRIKKGHSKTFKCADYILTIKKSKEQIIVRKLIFN